MNSEAIERFNRLIDSIGSFLDIPPEVYEDAEIKYMEVAEYLGEESSNLYKYGPELYPQGSFRLGTVVSPWGRDGEYDIDLVCKLNIDKKQISQLDLKQLVGNRLKSSHEYRQIIVESRRCWTLEYPDVGSYSFHMDVLPSIPNETNPPNGIYLTDKELRNWQFSNPIEYANWFTSRMSAALSRRKKMVIDEAVASIEDVPDWKVKTPLQRAVQILKRHRDICFDGKENKPVSIIITTLAAYAYNDEDDYLSAIINIINGIPRYIKKNSKNEWEVLNPVEPNENFADKWNEYPERCKAFFEWLGKAKRDFESLRSTPVYEDGKNILSESVGKVAVARADESLSNRSSQVVPVIPKGDTSHAQRPIWASFPISSAKIKITCYVHRKRTRDSKMWIFNKGSVPVGVWLRFVSRVDGVGEPYEIKWQVINTGTMARVNSQLRGEIEDGNGSTKYEKWEQTAYKGTHEVRAFVLKNGICVAQTSIDVPIR